MRMARLLILSSRGWLAGMVGVLVCFGCGLLNPANSLDYEPSRVALDELAIGVWLPAGLHELRFGAEDQRLLGALGINQVEWLQRAAGEGGTAEEMAMAFCNSAGLQMPVYYEPQGYTPYDKLHNWATRAEVVTGEGEALRLRVRDLKQQWEGNAGFAGYVIGHEDYRKEFYGALRQTVEVLKEEDGQRPALTVGKIDNYPSVGRFMEAFFVEGGVPNIFQHEHYVFRRDVPLEGRALQRQLDGLVAGYERVARHLQGHYGRWHAIVQVHEEVREEGVYYRQPTAAEIRVQAGLALARGASGIVYFLYSSGVEERKDEEGNVQRRWVYKGLVDEVGAPTPSYIAVQQLNEDLRAVGAVLQGLHFHGGFSSGKLLDNPLVLQAAADLEFGLYGDGARATHVLVVNRHTTARRQVTLEVGAAAVWNALTDEQLAASHGKVDLDLDAGAFGVLRLAP